MDGLWSNSEPTCDAITCTSDLSGTVVPNGEVTCDDSTNYGSVCTFTCGEGFELIGNSALTCTGEVVNAGWNGIVPTCEGPGEVATVKSSNTGVIFGAIFGGLGGIIVITIIVFTSCRKKKGKHVVIENVSEL